jgi:DNA polymerase elongation subunit (family B)
MATDTRNRQNAGFDLFDDSRDDDRRLNTSFTEASDFIVDIREYDVPYHVRVMIDMSEFSYARGQYCLPRRLTP